jgi:hypothetical protein
MAFFWKEICNGTYFAIEFPIVFGPAERANYPEG